MNKPLQLSNHLADDFHPSALADIYDESVTLARWRRDLPVAVTAYAQTLIKRTACFQTRFIQAPDRIAAQLEKELPLDKHRQSFIDDVALLTDMFSCLFELETVGLRMAVLNVAMCPKFHVDRVPCRLISTYAGAGSEWLTNAQVQRTDEGKLTPQPDAVPQKLCPGDVALLKGEAWEGNEGRGLVHRSPSASDENRRLVLTLDFA